MYAFFLLFALAHGLSITYFSLLAKCRPINLADKELSYCMSGSTLQNHSNGEKMTFV